jgi:hypothetical protein
MICLILAYLHSPGCRLLNTAKVAYTIASAIQARADREHADDVLL